MSLEGKQLGRYRLLELLGSGGMGEVYLAEDSEIKRQVAVKVMRSEPSAGDQSSGEAHRLFARELKAIARLDHPNILPLFDYGEGTLGKMMLTYLVMPLRREGTLADWLRERGGAGKLSFQDIARLIEQCAEALQHAHEHHIVHQDVKPSNFLVRSRRDRPGLPDLLLADFGVAKFNTTTASVSQSIRGTPSFMAPEQWRGQPVPATDQYALAVMAYLLLTGHVPFQGRMGEVMRQHLEVAPQPPTKLNSRLPAAVDAVLLRGLAKQPEERFASVTEFARALHSALAPAPAQTHVPVSIPDKEKTPIKEKIPTEKEKIPPVRQTRPVSARVGANTSARLSKRLPTGWLVLLAVLALLMIAFSSGLYYLISTGISNIMRQIGPVSAQTATANAVATDAVHNATAIANNEITTAVAEANNDQPIVTTNSLYPPGGGKLVLNDPLSQNSVSDNWDVSTGDTSCNFQDGGYVATASTTQYFSACFEANKYFSDFAYQVQMTIISGDYGGILFRGDENSSKEYYFRIGTDGTYDLYLYINSSDSSAKILSKGSIIPFDTDLGHTNLVAVVARGSSIDLYVDMDHIAGIKDNTYSRGQIGVAAEDDTGTPTQVVYDHAMVWQL